MSSNSARPVPEVIGRVLATLIPLTLMLWAASETCGFLHWALYGWSAFIILVALAHSALVVKS